MLSTTPLAELMNGRNNNFNLFRIMGALFIMYAHAGFVVMGPDLGFHNYPKSYLTGITMLNLFFVFSGFLVSASWIKRQNLISYATSRIMRIMPALLLMSAVTAFVIGPLVSQVSLSDYFSSILTYIYVPLTTLLMPDEILPGVFTGAPTDQEINAPLWTLRYEAICYIGIALTGLLGLLVKGKKINILIGLGLVIYIFVSYYTNWRQIEAIDHLCHFCFSFLFGVICYVYRDYIPINLFMALTGLIIALFIVYQYGLLAGEPFLIIFAALLSLWIGYVPGGPIRYYNGVGDYSYGLYIWHYPIEQTLRQALAIDNHIELFFTSLPFAVLAAILSWHLVERNALASVKTLVPWLQKILGQPIKGVYAKETGK